MAIHHPGSRAGTGVAIKAIRNAVVHGGGKGIFATLNVVPMIDLFTMLVLFLIQQFSASGELLTVNPNVSMPSAASPKELERAPIITLTRVGGQSAGDLLFENQRLMSLSDVNEVKFPDWDIKPLGMVLDCFIDTNKGAKGTQCYENSAWGSQQRAACPDPPKCKNRNNRKTIIQADRTVPFKIIKMVMATCGRHQYREPNFAVMMGEKPGAKAEK